MFQLTHTVPHRQVLQAAQSHLDRATCKHDYYKSVCKKSREQIEEAGLAELTNIDAPPCSHNLVLHLSFDFAQQV